MVGEWVGRNAADGAGADYKEVDQLRWAYIERNGRLTSEFSAN